MSPSQSDAWLVTILRLVSAVAGTIIFLILLFLIKESSPILQHINPFRFFTDPSWHPTENRFNLLPMLIGTLLITMGALIISAPLGIASAIFHRYYAPPKLADIYQRMIHLLAGIPSVVYGLWGLVVLVPMIRQINPPGPSLLSGTLILALMILPTIALNTDVSLSNLPVEYTQGAAALGLSRWETVRGVLLPASKSGLFTGVMLAAGRAMGETMAVLMVCGNVVQIPASLFDPIRTLTANIALEMSYAMAEHRASLFVSGLILMTAIIILITATELISRNTVYE